jgi:hypothetical protein
VSVQPSSASRSVEYCGAGDGGDDDDDDDDGDGNGCDVKFDRVTTI